MLRALGITKKMYIESLDIVLSLELLKTELLCWGRVKLSLRNLIHPYRYFATKGWYSKIFFIILKIYASFKYVFGTFDNGNLRLLISNLF